MRLNSLLQSADRAKDQVQSVHNTLKSGIELLYSIDMTILGEFVGSKAALFYSVVGLFSWVVSSSKNTNACRKWLFCLLVISMAMEKLCLVYFFQAPANFTFPQGFYAEFGRIVTWIRRTALVVGRTLS
jgi:hypothetical protein